MNESDDFKLGTVTGILQYDGLTAHGLTMIHYADGETVELMSMDETHARALRLIAAGHEAYSVSVKGRCFVETWRNRRERSRLFTPAEIDAWLEVQA